MLLLGSALDACFVPGHDPKEWRHSLCRKTSCHSHKMLSRPLARQTTGAPRPVLTPAQNTGAHSQHALLCRVLSLEVLHPQNTQGKGGNIKTITNGWFFPWDHASFLVGGGGRGRNCVTLSFLGFNFSSAFSKMTSYYYQDSNKTRGLINLFYFPVKIISK